MDLNTLRNKIDGIDREIVKLFTQRMEIAAEIGRYKQKNNLPVLNVEREKEILEKIAAESPENLQEYTEALYKTLFELSREYQNKAAYSGSEKSEG